MSTATRTRRRHAEHEEEEHENEERWLVSFADMMTLLFCLFMVLFAISSVNTSKFESLKKSLSESFNGQILSGGQAMMEKGATQDTQDPSVTPPVPSMMPIDAVKSAVEGPKRQARGEAAGAEQQSFEKLKERIDADAERLGVANKVDTEIRERGLVVQLLTDGVFFDSGQAQLKPGSDRILRSLGRILREERRHPITVEGYTDAQPIRSGVFPSNWELSGARASGVVRHFISSGVPMDRLATMGYAQQHPIASNATPQGRSRNRRVEVVLTRLHSAPESTQGGTTP